MTTSFADMPSWVIVAVMARIARHVQEFVADRGRLQREDVNDAIQVAEESARNALADPRASEFADRARRVSEDAIRNRDTRADVAALCASEAAAAVRLAGDRQDLVKAAERAMEYIRRFGKPESDRDLEKDIAHCAELARGLTNNDPSPTEVLDLVHRQAVHEAGHAVAAYLLGISCTRVRIIYHAGVVHPRNPISHPNDFTDQERSNYCLVCAAGAAAEDLLFGTPTEWCSTGDRSDHAKCGGTDFDGDASKVQEIRGFTKSALSKVASLLEARHCLPYDEVERALNDLQGDSTMPMQS
jgi:hypothetical protein